MTKHLCVYCASSPEIDPQYKQLARRVGEICALNHWCLITGAGGAGLMGAVADGCQEAGGQVTGIIPQWMKENGWLREGLDHVIITQTMAERKERFRQMADAIVVLPGGYGTMEEFFETLTLKQLKLFEKPLIILNYNGFYNHLIDWMYQCRTEQFLRHDSDILLWTPIQSPEELLPLLNNN